MSEIAPMVGHTVLYFAYIDSLLSVLMEIIILSDADAKRVKGSKIRRWVQMTDKLDGLDEAFADLPRLIDFKEEGLAIVDAIRAKKDLRDFLAHGGLDMSALRLGKIEFQRFRPSVGRNASEVERREFASGQLRTEAKELALLAARLLTLFVDLAGPNAPT